MIFIQILIISIWIIPIVIFTNMYLKMDKEDRVKIRTELKHPSGYLGLGVPILGALLLLTGIFSSTKVVQHIGVILLLGSWFATCVISWKKGNTSTMTSAALALLGFAGFIAYCYLI